MMDNGPMWSKDDAGRYWLVFPNKHALSKDEIKDIFSEFGTVMNIQTAGDEKGLRFVNYATVEDVEKAVDNLRNHSQIKLIPYRPKSKKVQNSNSASKDGQNNYVLKSPLIENNNDNLKRNFYQRKPVIYNNTTFNNEIISQTKQSAFNVASNYDTVPLFKGKSLDNDNLSTCSSNASGRKTKHFEHNHLMKHQISPSKSIEIEALPNSNNLTEKALHLFKLRRINSNIFTSTCESNIGSIKNSNSTSGDEIPDLVTKEQIAPKGPQKMIFNAEEVLVANIHTDYGSAYILHLFDRFEPLAISYIKELPKTETRYCHVYFKSAEDSIGVETQFDKYNLGGKKLVVLRPCRVMEEGMSED